MLSLLASLLLAVTPETPEPVPAKPLELRGVTLSGPEFAKKALPGIEGKHYHWPAAPEAEEFRRAGMNLIRLPFRWERLQPQPGGEFDPGYHAKLSATVRSFRAQGFEVLLDCHNYARHGDQVLGGALADGAFADLWRRLASEFKDDPHLRFGLMNEPHGLKSEDWVRAANAAIAAIRATGAKQAVFVCGNAWSGAHSWNAKWYGTPNAVAMLEVKDPADNIVFEVHQYLDRNGAGQKPDCASPEVGVEALQGFTTWLKQHKKRGFLGEFGGAVSPNSREAIDAMLKHMEENPEVWAGWAWWGGGQAWNPDYLFRLSSDRDGKAAPQMDWLKPHLR
ncbi:MAG: endoglucanase precursor (endo,4-beta-glucanase)(cellulase) protein [Verrucomicrobiota bacterium]|jgi:endoglucanase